jgi:hypothetical protein
LHSQGLADALRISLEFHREVPDDAGRALLHETLAEYRAAIRTQLGIDDPVQISTLLSCLLGILIHDLLDPGAVDVRGQVGRVRKALAQA